MPLITCVTEPLDNVNAAIILTGVNAINVALVFGTFRTVKDAIAMGTQTFVIPVRALALIAEIIRKDILAIAVLTAIMAIRV